MARALSTPPSPLTPPAPCPGPFEREIVGRLLGDRLGLVEGLTLPSETVAKPTGGQGLRAIPRSETAPLRRAPICVAVAVLLARALDGVPGLVEALRHATPRVIVEVPDPLALATLRGIWPLLLLGEEAVVEPITAALSPEHADEADILSLVVAEALKPRDKDALDRGFLHLLQVPRPVLGLAPDAGALLPPSMLRAAEHRLVLPPLDASAIAATLHVVTGIPCRAAELAGLDGLAPTLADLAIAIRADRSPAACIARLVELAGSRPARSGIGRDLTLDQLHGMDEAVAWARSTLRDVEAWRRGALPWAAVEAGLLLAGPPGVGKTLLPTVMAADGGMALVTGSLAQWQSQDAAHLGTTLRAMRQAFEEARAKAVGPGRPGCILMIDELSSFADRSRVTHDHRDYTVQIIDSLLELTSGATPREGVIVIGATNDTTHLDPALLRPGRLGRTIVVGHPDRDARLRMLRVRLGDELAEVDLTPVASRTERATGAQIEKVVADARRLARQAGRPLLLDDLLTVVGEAEADLPPALLRRIAFHEAGHAVVAALTFGTDAMVVALQSRDGAGGWLDLAGATRTAGTRAEIEAAIRVLLAGRAAEEAVLGAASAGACEDLLAATRLAARIYGRWGLAPGHLLALGPDDPAAILGLPDLRAEAARFLDRLAREARALLDRHRGALLRIAHRLLAERRLDGAAVAALIAQDEETGRGTDDGQEESAGRGPEAGPAAPGRPA